MESKFNGYDKGLIQFFDDLSNNNSKEWFDENRKYYEKEIRDTNKLVVSDLSYMFAERELNYIADPKISTFRINRDIRFSKDKSPYKTNMGLFFPYSIGNISKKPINALGLYFHVEPKECFVAGGIHTPPSEELRKIRELLSENYEEYYNLIESNSFRKYFPDEFEGEKLKTVPRGFPKDHPAGDLLKNKSFTFYGKIDQEIIYTSEIKEYIINSGFALTPLLDFFNRGLTK